MSKVVEKRAHPRATVSAPVEIYQENDQTLIGQGRLLNVSEFGACVKTGKPLKEGHSLVVRLPLAEHRVVSVPMRVMWSYARHKNTTEYGLRFGDIPDPISDLVQKYVNKFLRRASS